MKIHFCSYGLTVRTTRWACSLVKGHPGDCVFDRKDASRKEKVMIDTKLEKKDYRALYKDMHEKNKTNALRLFDAEADALRLREDVARFERVHTEMKAAAGFDRNISFDLVWKSVLKAYRNGGAGWISADTLPLAAEASGHTGWSAWYECTNGDNRRDEGIAVFTAAYSHRLGRWLRDDQSPCTVTHYRVLPIKESIK